MKKFFIRHKLSASDITHLSDSDSEIEISKGELKIEDLVEIETYESIFLGQVVDISSSSVEIEIIEKREDRTVEFKPSVILIQSLSNSTKFNYFLEKSVEVGIQKIIPVESKYSLRSRNDAIKDQGYWKKIVNDATEQSRNVFPTVINKPIRLRDLQNENIAKDSIKLCLATENVDTRFLSDFLNGKNIKDKQVYIAIGPEKGWSSGDIEVFKNLGFEFVKLNGNILRTETTGLVIGSIIKYLKGEI